nr:hypothetical protein [Theobroma cacao]
MGSERFEKSIAEWYEKRGEPSDYLNLEIANPQILKSPIGETYCFAKAGADHQFHSKEKQLNFLADCSVLTLKNLDTIWDRQNLFTRVSLRHIYKIQEIISDQGEQILDLQLQVQRLQQQVKNFQEVQAAHPPLTKEEVLQLVTTIAAQPKLVEEEALRLTANLEKQVSQVKHQLNEVSDLVNKVRTLLG